MSSGSPQYEFLPEHNILFGSLAYKMRWVGLFFVVVGVLSLLSAIFLMVAIYQHKLPAEWVNQLPSEAQSQLQSMPPKNELWGSVISVTLSGVIYLAIGIWTRSAAGSFQLIVDTKGNDITLLMKALSALHAMYNLIYMLLVVALMLFLIGVIMALWGRFG